MDINNGSLIETFNNETIGDNQTLTIVSETSLSSKCFQPTTLESVPIPMIQYLLIGLYSTTSLLALLGNVTVIIVALFGSESAATVRAKLVNLAVSDIVLGVLCVPFTYTDYMLGRWIFPHWLCPTAQYVQLLSVFVTSITLTIIGVERYMATLHPFSSIHRWLESHTTLTLTITWTLGALYALGQCANTYTRPFTLNDEVYYECSYDNNVTHSRRVMYMTANFILTFILPLFVMVFSYSAIMRKLIKDQNQPKSIYSTRSSGANGNRSPRKLLLRNDRNSNDSNSANSVDHTQTYRFEDNMMLLYGLCWAPIKLFQFLLDYGIISYCTEREMYTWIGIYFVCHWTAMSNSFVNPIVYSFMSSSFRNDLQKILKSLRTGCPRTIRHYSIKTVSTQVDEVLNSQSQFFPNKKNVPTSVEAC
ncbi:hypothetical protein BLOT_009401 [Blomia tropicalis]|nr:hypothetical protein BLOT_009401 [Blomia tropicalis]